MSACQRFAVLLRRYRVAAHLNQEELAASRALLGRLAIGGPAMLTTVHAQQRLAGAESADWRSRWLGLAISELPQAEESPGGRVVVMNVLEMAPAETAEKEQSVRRESYAGFR
jgi:transcriptional regulator with XRE-family HTH domain